MTTQTETKSNVDKGREAVQNAKDAFRNSGFGERVSNAIYGSIGFVVGLPEAISNGINTLREKALGGLHKIGAFFKNDYLKTKEDGAKMRAAVKGKVDETKAGFNQFKDDVKTHMRDEKLAEVAAHRGYLENSLGKAIVDGGLPSEIQTACATIVKSVLEGMQEATKDMTPEARLAYFNKGEGKATLAKLEEFRDLIANRGFDHKGLEGQIAASGLTGDRLEAVQSKLVAITADNKQGIELVASATSFKEGKSRLDVAILAMEQLGKNYRQDVASLIEAITKEKGAEVKQQRLGGVADLIG